MLRYLRLDVGNHRIAERKQIDVFVILVKNKEIRLNFTCADVAQTEFCCLRIHAEQHIVGLESIPIHFLHNMT